MSLILSNNTLAETSWYVYRDRYELFRGNIDAADGYYIDDLTGPMYVSVGAGPMYWNGEVDATPDFVEVVIGPDVEPISGGRVVLRNDLNMTSWWYIYGPDGAEVFNASLDHGQSVEVPNPAPTCRVTIESAKGAMQIADFKTTPGVQVSLNVVINLDPPDPSAP